MFWEGLHRLWTARGAITQKSFKISTLENVIYHVAKTGIWAMTSFGVRWVTSQILLHPYLEWNSKSLFLSVPKTSLPMFRSKQFAVKRRFSDFLGLYEKLSEKHSQNGFIVPPPPEKSLIGKPVVFNSTWSFSLRSSAVYFLLSIWNFFKKLD